MYRPISLCLSVSVCAGEQQQRGQARVSVCPQQHSAHPHLVRDLAHRRTLWVNWHSARDGGNDQRWFYSLGYVLMGKKYFDFITWNFAHWKFLYYAYIHAQIFLFSLVQLISLVSFPQPLRPVQTIIPSSLLRTGCWRSFSASAFSSSTRRGRRWEPRRRTLIR